MFAAYGSVCFLGAAQDTPVIYLGDMGDGRLLGVNEAEDEW